MRQSFKCAVLNSFLNILVPHTTQTYIKFLSLGMRTALNMHGSVVFTSYLQVIRNETAFKYSNTYVCLLEYSNIEDWRN